MLDAIFGPEPVLSYNRSPVTDISQVLQDTLLATLGVGLGQWLTTLVVMQIWPKMKDPWGSGDTFFAIIYFPPVVYLACYASWELSASIPLRWHGTSPRSYWYTVLYVARCLAHIVFLPKMVMKPVQRQMTIGHHILSTIAYGGILYTSRLQFWGAFDGVCEITNIFLTVLYIYKIPEVNLDSSDMLYKVNGFVLWLAFIVFRLMLFPFWLWLIYSDTQTSPAETLGKTYLFEVGFYCFVTVVLLVLSIQWFMPITKGIMKVFTGQKDTWTGVHGKSKATKDK